MRKKISLWYFLITRSIYVDLLALCVWMKESFHLVLSYLQGGKGLLLLIGHIANWIIEDAFDYLLYPFVIDRYGPLLGIPIMLIASFAICYGTILFYDYQKKDWLGLEDIKNLREINTYTGPVQKFFALLLKKGDFIVMVVLSIWKDPFITTVFMRKGSHTYNGMSKKDWKIFMISLLIGNIYWSFVVYWIVIPIYSLDIVIISISLSALLLLYFLKIFFRKKEIAKRFLLINLNRASS